MSSRFHSLEEVQTAAVNQQTVVAVIQQIVVAAVQQTAVVIMSLRPRVMDKSNELRFRQWLETMR